MTTGQPTAPLRTGLSIPDLVAYTGQCLLLSRWWGQFLWSGLVHRGPSLRDLVSICRANIIATGVQLPQRLEGPSGGCSWIPISHLEGSVSANYKINRLILLTSCSLLHRNALFPLLGPQIRSTIKASYCLD